MQEEILAGESTIKEILAKNPEITEAELLAKLGIDELKPEHCLQILEADPNVESIEDAPFEVEGETYNIENQYKPPDDFSVNFLHPDAKLQIKKMLKFTNLPVILDKFEEEHDTRREWKNKLAERFPSVYRYYQRNNALGLNTVENATVGPIIFLQRFAEEEHPRLAQTLGDILDRILYTELGVKDVDVREGLIEERVREIAGTTVLVPERIIEIARLEILNETGIKSELETVILLKKYIVKTINKIYQYQKSLESEPK